MAGKLFDLVKRDSRFFVTKGGFQEDIIITNIVGDKTLNITGFATKHHFGIDLDGNAVNTKNVHVCISELDLVNANYPTRNARQEIDLYKHRISFKDSSGLVKNYVVKEVFPDETNGLIVLILGDFRW